MLSSVLVEQYRNISRRRLAGCALEIRESHHDRCHLVLVNENIDLGKLLIVAYSAVTAEQIAKKLSYVDDDEILLLMSHSQVFTSETLSESVYHHRHCQIVGHPAVSEHCLDITRHHDEFAQCHHNAQPAPVIVKCVAYAAPLTAFSYLAVRLVKVAVPGVTLDLLRIDHFVEFSDCHYSASFWIFLISMLSMNACTRVRICPEEPIVYGRSTASTGHPYLSLSLMDPIIFS